MSDRTNYCQLANLEANLGLSPSAPRYLALMTAAGTDGAPGTECADAYYVRQVIAFNAPTTNASNCSTSNSGQVTFPAFAAQQTIVEWSLWDAVTGGNRLYHKALTPQAIAAGNQLAFLAGAITVTEA